MGLENRIVPPFQTDEGIFWDIFEELLNVYIDEINMTPMITNL